MSASFVHLHLHTEYSLVDSIIRIKSLVGAARKAGMPAVAVTDQSNLFSMVKFYRAAQAAGIKPIVGADLWILDEQDDGVPCRLVLLCQDRIGYHNLARLVSRGYTEGQVRGVPTLRRGWLKGQTDGLIALSGGPSGDVGRALLSNPERAAVLSRYWREKFPNRYYLQVQRTGRTPDENHLHASVDLAAAEGLPLVASNDVRFLAAEDFEAHEARVCIQQGRTLDDPRRPRDYNPEQYLRAPEEMGELFSDLPEALENTVAIARRCNLELSLGKNYLPAFPIPEGMGEAEYFVHQARVGLEKRLATLFDVQATDFPDRRRPYDERLQTELDVIQGMGFPGYFLIVADFIRWAKANGVPVGPGRGSGAGSLVAYALEITDLDPIQYDLLFERFLNPERVSMPDFDVDFCMEGRDRVIEYVAETYGRDRVSQIITYGSMAAKAVVRDVGRVLNHPYGFVDKIAKLVPFDLKMTLDKALAEEPELDRRYREEDDVRTLLDLARKLEGLARNAGKHAGGVVISPSVITDFTPLYCEQGAAGTVTQFDKDDVEAVGLVKFDFLGLRTLTIIDWAVRTINRRREQAGEAPLDISRLPIDDRESFELIKRGATTAVFQLESRGMKELIRRLLPDCFEDVVALVALFRPGPLQSGMVDDFINRKHGRARVEYPHPDLEPILKPTYGVILYQEQVMQIAQVLANYTLGGADLLRRAMGKKKAEEMAKQREIFLNGARDRGVDEAQASHIFDLMEKFAGYGFNKSHSAAYALVAYQTAWLKAHYPAAFMAAVLSADMDNTDKVVGFIDECRDMGLEIRPPDVNHCEYAFTVQDEKTILYGLGAIKGVGQGAIENLIGQRQADGGYEDLFDFCRRVDTRKLNRRALEAMIRAGALDGLGPSRAAMMATLTRALQAADQYTRDQDAGQVDLFGGGAVTDVSAPDFAETGEWPVEQRLAAEKETLGLYLTGHPIGRYEAELAHFVTGRLSQLRPTQSQSVVVAGLVVALRVIDSKRGRMAVATLDDRTGRVEATLFSDTYSQFQGLLGKDRLLVVEGEMAPDERSGGYSVTVRSVYDISHARGVFARRLLIRMDAEQAGNGMARHLADVLGAYREGNTPVYLDYQRRDARVRLSLGEEWRVNPCDELLHRLGELTGGEGVQVEY